MNRFEDTPEMFGVGCGSSTAGDLECDLCHRKYNEGADAAEDYHNRDYVGHTDFAGLTVCRDCFGIIEQEILERMPAILSWYKRILDAREKRHIENRDRLNALLGGKES